jgi:SNF2 family DNA or RNA helicase
MKPRWAKNKRKRVLVPTRHVKAFLNRKRDDWRPYLDLTTRNLRNKWDALPVEPAIPFDYLNDDQRPLFLIGAKTHRFCFWADTGTGKTLLSIALTRYHRRLWDDFRSVLVLVPTKLNKAEWAREIKKHSPKSTCVILTGSSENKLKQLEGNETFIIETYGGFVKLLTKLVEAKKKKKQKLEPVQRLIQIVERRVQGLIMDESIHATMKKKHGSLIHRLCRRIADNCDMVYALNGTPFGKDPIDLWGQFKIVDGGYTLGETLGLFRAAFYNSSDNFWGGQDYTFDRTKERMLHNIIAHRSIRIEADKSKLPHLVPRLIEVRLPVEAESIYEQAKSTLIASHGSFKEMNNAFLRLRQISSGFVGYWDDETGEKAKYVFSRNPKLDALLGLVDEICDHSKFIIFHDFIFSGRLICDELKAMGVGYVSLRDKKTNPDDVLERFNNDNKVRGFVLNNQMAAGLNLQVARYGLFYESPVPVITRKQAVRRFERQYSKHDRVWLYDFVVRGTQDARILEFHKTGEDFFRTIIDGGPSKRRQLLAA